MKRLLCLVALLSVAAMPAFAAPEHRVSPANFASDFQTLPAVANVTGAGGAVFQTYVSILNPTPAAFPVAVSLFDANGTRRDATINLAAGELKTFDNFLAEVFNFTGAGAATFAAPTPADRFILNAEVWTSGTRFTTTLPVVEFPGSTSPAYAAGVTVSSSKRTNVGCFNQSGVASTVRVTVFDKSGAITLGSQNLNLAANGWFQTAVPTIVSDGYIKFEPSEPAICYAVVVDNVTNDGSVIAAVEYAP